MAKRVGASSTAYPLLDHEDIRRWAAKRGAVLPAFAARQWFTSNFRVSVKNPNCSPSA